jgi:hypothetical protein
MKKENLVDELVAAMHTELLKQGSVQQPNLIKASECLHSALEILEEQGLKARADQVLNLLEKIGKEAPPVKKSAQVHSLQQIMEAGVSQRDLMEFARGNPIATAKINLVLRKLGVSDHELASFLGPAKVLSEEDAHKAMNPNQMGSVQFNTLFPEAKGPDSQPTDFQSVALSRQSKKIASPTPNDPHTQGLTPEKMVDNLKNHGTMFNMSDDGAVDIGASDDELMDFDVKDDSLEVFDKDIPLEDFEDERD